MSLCMVEHGCVFSKDFPNIDRCAVLVLCMLKLAVQAVINLILSRIDEANDLSFYRAEHFVGPETVSKILNITEEMLLEITHKLYFPKMLKYLVVSGQIKLV